MSQNNALGRAQRAFRRHLRPVLHRLRYGTPDLPIVFGNSFPKSGTNLLMQILRGLERLDAFLDRGMFILTYQRGRKRTPAEIARDLARLQAGEIAGGHLFATDENLALLRNRGARCYFIYRDPRDVVVSHAYYVTDMARTHAHHEYYAHVLSSMEERITTSIMGRPAGGIEFPDIRARFEPYLGWLDQDFVLPLRFEDLIHNRQHELGRILDHLEAGGYHLPVSREQALEALERAINPARSPTFREGRTGAWREHFTAEHRRLFAQVSGDLLKRLGYEEE